MVVFIEAFRPVAEAMTVPRALITPHLMGRTCGAPGEYGRQRQVVAQALELLATAAGPGTLADLRV